MLTNLMRTIVKSLCFVSAMWSRFSSRPMKNPSRLLDNSNPDPTEKLTRAEVYIELLECWEYLYEICSQPPYSMGKVLMLQDLDAAIDILKRTYDLEDLMNVEFIKGEINGSKKDNEEKV